MLFRLIEHANRLGYWLTQYASQFGPWNWWTFYWVVIWFGLGFGIPEGYALATNPDNTLSDQVWRAENMAGPWGLVFHIIFTIGFGWLFFHMVDRLFR